MASIHSYAQSKSDYDVSKDKENGAVVFKGKCTFEDLNNETTFSWLKKGDAAYKPNKNDIAYLKKHLSKYRVIVFMGTWCDDSYKMLPQIEKVLQESSFPMDQFAMYGVDRNKEAKYIEHKLYRISNVPTVIVIRGHEEIGRITETVKKSVEDDLVNIIRPYEEQDEAAAAQGQMNK